MNPLLLALINSSIDFAFERIKAAQAANPNITLDEVKAQTLAEIEKGLSVIAEWKRNHPQT